MKLLYKLLVLGLSIEPIFASTWYNNAGYKKWHETELERWLSDNNIPYSTPADRKDLENLIKEKWHAKILSPYKDWNTYQLASYLKQRGVDTLKEVASNQGRLTSLVKDNWLETEEMAEEAWSDVKNWIFDSWSDSQLKAFADKHNIPVPQPRNRNSLLQSIRSNFESVATKAGETISYPGDWLYGAWSESDLNEYLDSHGISAPQPAARDKLIASVRRNSRLASLKMADMASSASASASSATEAFSDKILETWSDSQIKEWCDKKGIKVPQGSRRNELIAIVRKHHNILMKEKTQASSVTSTYGAATSKAGNEYAKATDDARLKMQDAFNAAISTWSDSRLKAYLDARGIPCPQRGERDELIAAVRLNAHKISSPGTAWTYDTWTLENLRSYLLSVGDSAATEVASKVDATRNDLIRAAQSHYSQASKLGGTAYSSATSYLAKQTDAAKEFGFDTWTESDLKAYLDTYGVFVPKDSTMNDLKSYARNQAIYFRYGTTSPQDTLWARISEAAQWVKDQLRIGIAFGYKRASSEAEETIGRASNKAEQASSYGKEEL